MPTIYADTNDGLIAKINQSSHANARDASSGTASTTATSINTFLYQSGAGRGGGTAYSVRRIFFYFDTSGITSTLASATFNIKRTTGTIGGEMQLVKSNAFGGDGQTALANGDFDAFPGFSAGNTMDGNVTTYASTIDPVIWGSTNAFSGTGIALNSTALSDMVSNDYLIFGIVNSDFDFKNVDDNNTLASKYPFYTANMSSTSSDPKIDYTLATGYSHDVLGLAAASIAEVNTVAIADIAELNGLD